jgi:hypothetical protein
MLSVRRAIASLVRRRDSRVSAIARHVIERGGRVLDIHRVPFASAWFGESVDPIFDVRYRDPRGVERLATCKVSASGALAWLDRSRDPRTLQRREPLISNERGVLREVVCPFCGTKVYRGAKRCGTCRVPFVGT